MVMDWDQIVRHVSVSSNEAQAYRLMDGIQTTYWQSSGTQGKVRGRGCRILLNTTYTLEKEGFL